MSVSSILGTNSSTYNLLKQGIKATDLRGQVIANNMANVNTKNYKKFSVVFEENLKGNSEGKLGLVTNNDRHISTSGGEAGEISVKKDTSTSMRTDGNNVDLDVEKVNQAANTIKYNGLVQLASGRISNTSYVITQ